MRVAKKASLPVLEKACRAARALVFWTPMRIFLPTLLVAAMAATVGAQPPAAAAKPQPRKTHLKVGDAAPDFTLRTTENSAFTLSAQRGKTVVVAFFPAAFTGG